MNRTNQSASANSSEKPVSIAMPAITDAASIQQAISDVLDALGKGTLEPARARVLLYGLHIAATNARRIAAAEKAVEPKATAAPATEAVTAEVVQHEEADPAPVPATQAEPQSQAPAATTPAETPQTSAVLIATPPATQEADNQQPAAPVVGYVPPMRARMMARREFARRNPLPSICFAGNLKLNPPTLLAKS